MMNIEIKNGFKHSKIGTIMFKVCAKWTKFCIKHKFLYYILACTWGSIMTLIGFIAFLIFTFVHKFNTNIEIKNYAWMKQIKTGPKWWGGCSLGLTFFRDWNSSEEVSYHEFGHTFQNCLFGPLAIFMIFIPSCIRYWYQTIRESKGKPNKEYDGIWFEDSATQCGLYAIKYLNSKTSK